MSGGWRGTLWTLLVTFCIITIRFTETSWLPCISSDLLNTRYSEHLPRLPIDVSNHVVMFDSEPLRLCHWSIFKITLTWNSTFLSSCFRVWFVFHWLVVSDWLTGQNEFIIHMQFTSSFVSFFKLCCVFVRRVWMQLSASYRFLSEALLQESYVYRTVHHCDCWRIKDQLDVTCYFISLLMCSTCFGH